MKNTSRATPSCRECGKPLKQWWLFGDKDVDPKRERQFGYNGDGIFCSLRCGYRQGVALVKKHYREGTP